MTPFNYKPTEIERLIAEIRRAIKEAKLDVDSFNDDPKEVRKRVDTTYLKAGFVIHTRHAKKEKDFSRSIYFTTDGKQILAQQLSIDDSGTTAIDFLRVFEVAMDVGELRKRAEEWLEYETTREE